MFQNNLKLAWRNILKHKIQTGINIVGLAIGISGCLVVFLLANYELNFHKSIIDKDRIFRVYTQYTGQYSGAISGVPTGLANMAPDVFQGTEVQCLMQAWNTKVHIPVGTELSGKKDLGSNKDIIITGPEFFDLIQNYEWLAGSPRKALSEPFQVVLTEDKIKQYFGMKDAREALGKDIIYADSLRLTISGVIKNPTFASDFHFTDFISQKTILASFLKDNFPIDEWGGVRSTDQFFIKASKGESQATLTKKLQPLIDRFNIGQGPDSSPNEFRLQALSDLHFNQELGTFDNGRKTVHKPTLYGLIGIAALILLIAMINFINLATVQASRRSRETGVRKVIGASKGQITKQFLTETFLLTMLALPVSILLSNLAMEYFKEFLPEGLILNISSPPILLFLLGTVMAVTFLAGLYPSFVMSAFQPIVALKNSAAKASQKGVSLRKGLIVFQFVLAQAFIIGALIMGQQLNFLLHKDLGFNKEEIVYFWCSRKQKNVFKEQLEQLPFVKSTALQNKAPIEKGYQTSVLTFNKNGEKVDRPVHFRMVDTSYINLYDIELLAGRNLLSSDTMKEVLINQTFAKEMGFNDEIDAIGKSVSRNNRSFPIVGVIKDFHVQSLHHKIPPVAITANTRSTYSLAVKIKTEQPISESLSKIKGVWTQVFPNKDYNPFFLDEKVEEMYKSEAQFIKLINTATGLAILISCLGLFGLAFFTVTQRSKEISVRKILGATTTGLVVLLSKDFIKLVMFSLIIATPIAYFLIKRWLQDFAYNVGIEWWTFLLAGIAAISIAFITISFQSIKAALASPVKSLRSD